MVFQWFSDRFPIVFPWLTYGFLWFSYGFWLVRFETMSEKVGWRLPDYRHMMVQIDALCFFVLLPGKLKWIRRKKVYFPFSIAILAYQKVNGPFPIFSKVSHVFLPISS